MISDIKAKVEQIAPETGEFGYLRMTRLGQLLTASWKENLMLEGRCWVVTIGSMVAGSVTSRITGGGAGTCINQDQPEGVIGVDTGYFLIPVEIMASVYCDVDADTEYVDIIATVDRAAAVPTSLTGTIETPLNLLDGAATFPGRAFSAVTADITDPTVSEILDEENLVMSADGTGGGTPIAHLKMHYEPVLPSILAGPCGLYLYWGGTAATLGVARIVVAAIPTSWAVPS